MDRPTFSRTLVRPGYDRAQVDEAVERILRRDPSMTADAVAGLSFPTSMYQRGYDTTEVDAWLDAAVVELGGRPAELPQAAATPAPAATPATPEPHATGPTTGDIAQAATVIFLVVAATVWFYVSRF